LQQSFDIRFGREVFSRWHGDRFEASDWLVAIAFTF
jgi:hypothetical protein